MFRCEGCARDVWIVFVGVDVVIFEVMLYFPFLFLFGCCVGSIMLCCSLFGGGIFGVILLGQL